MPVGRYIRGSQAAPADPAIAESLLAAVKLALRIDGDEFDTELSRNIQAATERADRQAPGAPDATTREAVIRFTGFIHEGPTATAGHNEAGIWRRCGAEGLLAPWTVRRAGVIGG